MKRLWTALNVTLQTTAVSFLVGFALGGVYGAFVVTVELMSGSSTELGLGACLVLLYVTGVGGAMGAMSGGILGGTSGAAAGLITGAVATVAFFPLTAANLRRLHVTFTVVDVAVSAATAYLLTPYVIGALAPAWANDDRPDTWAIYALVPGLVAGLGAWWVSRRVAQWYLSESMRLFPETTQ